MDRASLLELMAYTDFAWQELESGFNSDDKLLQRAAPGSGWPALRNCLAHILLGRERWNDAIIEGKSSDVPSLPDDKLSTWSELNAYRRETGSRLAGYIKECDDEALFGRREFDIDGVMLTYSRGELALHLTLHEIQHHGDISTLQYQLGLEPWVPHYRFFVNPDA